MAISDNYTPNKTLGNGVTTQFSGNWNVINSAFMRVYLESVATGVQTLQTLNTHYTLSFNESGYTVTMLTPPTSANYVVRARAVSLDQGVPYKTSQGFQGAVQENSFDKLTAICQDLQDQLNRAPKVPIGNSVVLTIDEVPEAGRALIGNPGATGYINGPDATDIANAQSNAAVATAAAAAAQAAQAAAEAAAAGQKWRPSVKAATTANITLSGAQTIDTVSIVAGDRVLVKNQSSSSENGVYVAASGAWSRATDADTWDELVSQVVAVEDGATYADHIFICTINQGGTLGVTAVTWYDNAFIIASQAEAEAGAENTKGMTALRTKQAIDFQVNAKRVQILHVRDEKSSGTAGGTFPATAWTKRDLNTEVYDGIGSTLSSSEFTLPAGTYKIRGTAPAFSVSQHQCRLYNVTDAAVSLVGTSEITNSGAGDGVSRSEVNGIITIAGTKTFRLEHYSPTGKTTNGFGVNASSPSTVEVFSELMIEKIA